MRRKKITREILIFLLLNFLGTKAFSQYPDYSDSTITTPASTKYHAQFLGRVFLGNHYRDVWSAPVTLHYLDMSNQAGGLTPLKLGGGLETKSLRLMGADSNQYVIRTIDKDPSKTISSAFQNTVISDLLQDQISASHPYAPLVVAKLSDDAGIYHSNPKILYVPDDPRLGKFRNDFKYRVVLFEERELNSANVAQGLGGFKKVISTFDLYDAIRKSSDNKADQRFTLRSRLFDMLIGDWDRHEDQWRWAEFKLPDEKIFRPIPRDRDQAFFNFDGVLPTYASLNVAATRKMQRYKPMPVNTNWFNYNARFFDRTFLNELSRNDWKEIADSLMTGITDQQIEDAFKVWPDTIYKLTGPQIISTLKQRRNNLPLIADEYYAFLAKQVDVVGTDKRDYFEVKRADPNVTDVSVYQFKDGVKGKLTYHRVFSANETKEIRLYGLDGRDVFNLYGKAQRGSLLRVIGGKGADSIIDRSSVGGFGKRTKVYDSKEGNYLALGKEARNYTSDDTILNTYNRKEYEYGKEAKNKTSKDTTLNTYNRREFNYNFTGALPAFGYNVDDGIFIGTGFNHFSYGFKKFPYKNHQTLSGQIAFKTAAFSFKYRGDFTDVIGKLDLVISANVLAPNYRQNFFGFGNETPIDSSYKFYRLRITQGILFPALELGNQNKLRFLFGPIYQQAQLREDENSTVFNVLPELKPLNRVTKYYLGVNTQFVYDKFDRDTLPHFEAKFLVNAGNLYGLNDDSINFGFIRGEVSFSYTFYSPIKIVIATRFGGGHNVGDFEFYQANNIGGRNTVRGFRGERYSGRSSLYNNLEARIKLFHFNAYVFPADFGIIGLLDNGRVWSDGETSNKIHTGYGGGIWLSPFGLAVLTATYSFSQDQPNGLLNVKLGWWF